MNNIILSASPEMAIASGELMPLLTQSIIAGLLIVTFLVFFRRSALNVTRTNEL